MPDVRCSGCGLLALRSVHEDQLFEANLEFRETGKPTSPQGKWIYQYTPLCFARALDLHEQLHGKGHEEVRDAINQPIDCKSYLPWTQGYSPKEHADMELQRQILELQIKRDDSDREWRAGQAALDKEWRKQQAREERAWREQQATGEHRRHIINLIVYGLLAIFAGIIGSAIQANWIQKPAILNVGTAE